MMTLASLGSKIYSSYSLEEDNQTEMKVESFDDLINSNRTPNRSVGNTAKPNLNRAVNARTAGNLVELQILRSVESLRDFVDY
jgi:hypothetical protein